MKPAGRKAAYRPNVVPGPDRWWNTSLGLVLLAWGIAGLYTARFEIRTRGRLIVALREGPAWLMGAAAICGGLVLLSVVIDHYDRRNNEEHYRTFKWVAVRLGWCFFTASLLAHLYWGFTK